MMRKLINPFQVKSFGLWIIVLLGLPTSTHARNIFYIDNYKTSITTILTDQKNSICENGFLYAFNGSWVFRKWHAKTELCYKVDTNKRLVFLKDPSKLIFSSSQIPAESFVYIPSAQEKAAQEDAQELAVQAINESNLTLEEKDMFFVALGFDVSPGKPICVLKRPPMSEQLRKFLEEVADSDKELEIYGKQPNSPDSLSRLFNTKASGR